MSPRDAYRIIDRCHEVIGALGHVTMGDMKSMGIDYWKLKEDLLTTIDSVEEFLEGES